MNDIMEVIDSLETVFFDRTEGNRRVVAGGWMEGDGTKYKIISYIDFDNGVSPLVWLISYPQDIQEFAAYLETEVAWLNKGVCNE